MEDNVSVRIGKKEMNELTKLSQQERLTRSVLLREVLRLGIQQKRLEYALLKFQKHEATAAKAASIAGVPLTRFLDLLKERGLEFHYTKEDLLDDMKDFL